MQKLVALDCKSKSAVDANQSRGISLASELPEVMVARTGEVLTFLGLGSLALQMIPNPDLPANLPHAYFPEPRALFAALGKKLSPREFSAVCQTLLGRYGDTVSGYLKGKLCEGLVKPDPTNLNAWKDRMVRQPSDVINVYEMAVSPITRFQTGDSVYNLPACDARKPLLAAGMVPGGILEWAIVMAVLPDIKTQIVHKDPWVVHPGSKVHCGVGGWTGVSCCCQGGGHAGCGGGWGDGGVGPDVALFALL